MDFGAYPVGRQFTIQEEHGPVPGLPGYVLRKKTNASALVEKELPGMPENLFRWIGHEVFFPANFPIVPYYEAEHQGRASAAERPEGVG
jgi:hypothetical protein